MILVTEEARLQSNIDHEKYGTGIDQNRLPINIEEKHVTSLCFEIK